MKLGTKSLIKLSKISAGILSLITLAYFIWVLVIPVFATLNSAQTYVNTTTFPDKFSRNGTGEGFNFTITLTNGNVSEVNITVPNTTSSATNFTVDITSDVPFTNASGTWSVFYTNYTSGNPRNITFNVSSDNAFTSSATFNIKATPNVSDTNDNITQAWLITVKYNETGTSDSTTVYTFVDSQNPRLSDTTPPNASYIKGTSSQLFNVTISELNLNTSNVTFHWKVDTGGWNNTTAPCSGTPPNFGCANYIDLAGLVVDGNVVYYFFEAMDNSSNYNSNGTFSSPLTATVDQVSPQFGNVTTGQTNGTSYSPGKIHTFNITWTDAGAGVSTVLFESNVTGSFNNTTAVSLGSNNYSVTFYDLGAAIYQYKWYANDAVTPAGDANWNNTTNVIYNVSINTSNPVNLYFNGTANQNRTYTYPEDVNATVEAVFPSSGTVFLYRDGTQVATGTSPRSENVKLPNATHQYKANITGNANYSSNSTGLTFYVLVNKGTTTVTVLLNGTAANITVGSGSFVNATVSVDNSEGNITLWRDNVLYNSSTSSTLIQNISQFNGSAGATFNITGFFAQTQNYSSGTTTRYVILDSSVPTFANFATNITNGSTIGKVGNGSILISASWNDNYALDKYWYESNETGSRVNSSASSFSTGNWSNISLTPSTFPDSILGKLFIVRLFANDTTSNYNNTAEFQFTVDGTAPSLTSIVPANNTFIAGSSSQLFSVTVTDTTLNASNVTLRYRVSPPTTQWINVSLTCYGPSPYVCNSSVDLSTVPNDRSIQYFFEATDGSQLYGFSGTSSNYYNVTIDRTPPQFSNVAQNASIVCKFCGVNLSALWTDNQNLSFAILETNETGTAANQSAYGSPFAFTGGTSSTVSFNWTNPSVAVGTTVTWRIFANDSEGIANVTGYTNFTIDGTAPQMTFNATNVTNLTTFAKGTVINLSSTFNDNLQLDKWWVQHNGTGTTQNVSFASFSVGNISNSLINTTSFTNGADFFVRIFANDTSGNENNTASFMYKIDGTPPQFSNNATTTVTTYGNGQSNFTITWTDDIDVSTALLENNFTGTFINFTMTNDSTSWSYNLTLPAGTFVGRFIANDTSNNFNATPNFTVTVLPGNVSLNLALNGTESNVSYVYPAVTNATAWRNATVNNEGTLTLQRNGTTVATSASGINNVSEIVQLGNWTSNYTVIFTATNYSTNSISDNRFALVNKGVSNISLFINGTEANSSVQQGQAVNFTATINTTYNVNLTLNTTITNWPPAKSVIGTSISNITSTGGVSGTDFNITSWFDGDQNWTADSQTWFLNITADATGPTILILEISNATARKSNASLVLNLSVSDAGVGLATTGNQCNVTVSGVATENVSYSGTSASGFCNGTITIPAAGLLGADGNKTLNITIADTSGNVGVNDSFVLQIDNTAPTLTISVPASVNGTYNKTTSSGFTWINGTITDNFNSSGLIGSGNVTLASGNTSNFMVYSWNGLNGTSFAIRNSSSLSDGNYSITLTFNDSANNTGQTAISFFKDDTAPSVVIALTNSSSGKYQPNSTQRIYVILTDNLKTNDTITVSYYLSSNSTWTNTTASLVSSPASATSTYATGTIDTTDMVDNQYIKFFITGADNATNAIAGSVAGTFSSPLANLTIDFYCGNNGVALAFCSRTQLYDLNWRSLDLPPANVVQNWTSLSNNFTIPSVLSSISGKYNYVYYYNGTDWLSFDPSVALALNDLKVANNTNNVPYWVNMTAFGIVRIS